MGKIADILGFKKPPRITPEEYLAKLLDRGLSNDGQFTPDPTPMAPPIGYKKQPSMVEIVRDMVRSERLRQEALDSDMETLEEADDFDVADDPIPLESGYENDLDPPIGEMLRAGHEEVVRKVNEEKGGGGGPPPPKAPSPAPVEPGVPKAP